MDSSIKNVLVIGNGFDLHHGMKTSYADLLRFYISVRDKSIQYELDSEKLDIVMRWIENSFFDYFISDYEERKRTKTWIDLEHGVKQYIKTVLDFFNNQNEGIRKKDLQKSIALIDYRKHSQEIVHMLLNSHCLGETGKDYIKIADRFITFQGLYDLDAMIEAFAEELTQLEKIVSYYLETIEPFIRCNKNEYRQFEQIHRLKPEYVISFNYTKTICDLYNFDFSNISFVHGELTTKNVVLGYDDIDHSDDDIVFKKYYRRIIKRTNTIDYTKMHDQEGGFLIERNVFIFGHSLDISDEDILRPILERYNTTIFYLDDVDYAKKIRNLFMLLEKEEALEKIYSGEIKFEKICK